MTSAVGMALHKQIKVLKKNQQDATLQMVFITINASMFQAVPSPIIRSSKPYTQHRVFVERFLLLTAIVSELEPPTHSQ